MTTKPPSSTAGDAQPIIRCAIYTRYSSEEQRKTSTEDQLRNCRVTADRNGWLVLDEFIRSDEETTGRTLAGRQGIGDLIELAKQRPKPFDCILIDDTSRLGRYLPDVLRECDRFMHHGVFLYFATDRLDSRDGSFRIMHIFKGYRDEDFVRDLGHKIHRGQEGRVLNGYVAGNRGYGYRNVPIPDENGKSSFGRPALKGVKQEIIPEEAEVVRKIMEMRASEFSFGRIAKALKAEGINPPRNPNKAGVPAWYASTVKEITRNELYRGWRVWNRTQNVFNQAEGKKSKRNRPQSEWVRVEVPELRIISDELWEKVQAVNRRVGDKYYATRMGGMNRTEHSRKYPFSGVMVCGICGGPYTVINGKAPNVRYGCPNHRFRDTCNNKATILRTRLEHQLISALSTNLLDPRLQEERTREFVAQLKARIEQEEKLAQEAEVNRPALEKERFELSARGRRLSEAIAMTGHSPFLLEQLKGVDSRLAEIDDRLRSKPVAKLPNFSDEQIREFLRKESSDFCDLLTGDPEAAKREIRKRIKQLVLTPKQTPNRTVIEVAGDVELFRHDDVVLNNSLDGTVQQYNLPRVLITAVLDPQLRVAP
jgi:DNA invertase Pin-like site-specific DNA recombinase